MIAVAVGLLAGAQSAPAARCPSGGKTVVRSDSARVWGVTPKSGITRYYGCAFRYGRVVRLDPRHGQLVASKRKVKLAGGLVAYEALDFDLKPYRVLVRSLRSGKLVHSALSNRIGSAEGHTGPVQMTVLKRSGSVAWTASAQCICEGVENTQGYEVHLIGGDSRHRVVDSGTGVDPASLAIRDRGRRISWTDGGVTRTARFT